jgi:hypothetical protein
MSEVALDFRKTRDRLLSIESAIRSGGTATDQMWLDAFNALLTDLAQDRRSNPPKSVQTDAQRQSQLANDLKKISRDPQP